MKLYVNWSVGTLKDAQAVIEFVKQIKEKEKGIEVELVIVKK